MDLFFVLSGFLIGGILVDVLASPNYFKNILSAIDCSELSPFIISGLLFTSWWPPFQAGFSAAREQPQLLFLFLQNFGIAYSSQLATAWFLPAWSLAVEEQFYLIAPLLIRLKYRDANYIGCSWRSNSRRAGTLLRIWVRDHIPQGAASLSYAYTLMPCRAQTPWRSAY